MQKARANNTAKIRQASLAIRLGLAAVFIYAAVSAFVTPSDWVGYLPHIITSVIPSGIALKLFSASELALGLWLISGKFVRYGAMISALTMLAIIASDIHLFAITFRDIAIGAAAIALAILAD